MTIINIMAMKITPSSLKSKNRPYHLDDSIDPLTCGYCHFPIPILHTTIAYSNYFSMIDSELSHYFNFHDY